MNMSTLLSMMILLATNLFMLWLAKDEIMFRAKLWIGKKLRKPMLEVDLYRSDKTKCHKAIEPDTLNRTILVDGNNYMYMPSALNYNPQLQVQCIVLREGCVNAIDTQEWKPGEVDPQRIAVALKVAKQRGREEADHSFENYKKYLWMILAASVAAAAISLMTLQNTDAIQASATTILAMLNSLSTPAAPAAAQVINGSLMP